MTVELSIQGPADEHKDLHWQSRYLTLHEGLRQHRLVTALLPDEAAPQPGAKSPEQLIAGIYVVVSAAMVTSLVALIKAWGSAGRTAQITISTPGLRLTCSAASEDELRLILDRVLAAPARAGDPASTMFTGLEEQALLESLLAALLGDADPFAWLATHVDARRPAMARAGRPAAATPKLLHALHDAAVRSGLLDASAALLAGLPASLTAGLTRMSNGSAQLLKNLEELSEARPQENVDPLSVWIENAMLLTSGRAERSVFEEGLAERSRALRASAVTRAARALLDTGAADAQLFAILTEHFPERQAEIRSVRDRLLAGGEQG